MKIKYIVRVNYHEFEFSEGEAGEALSYARKSLQHSTDNSPIVEIKLIKSEEPEIDNNIEEDF